MHGRRKKDVVELSPEEKEKQSQQVKTARTLFAKLLGQRQAKVYSQQTLDMTSKALHFHPEFPTLWGYRREILESGQADGELWQLLKTEMKLLEGALRKSQKVYSIWFHRRWVVERLFELCGPAAEKAQALLDTELSLCRQLLGVDERNFHCWNHRAHVLCLMRRLLAARAASAPPEAADGGGEAAAGGAAASASTGAAGGGGDAGAGGPGAARPAAGPDAAGGPQPGAGQAAQAMAGAGAGPEAGAGAEAAAAAAGAEAGAGTEVASAATGAEAGAGAGAASGGAGAGGEAGADGGAGAGHGNVAASAGAGAEAGAGSAGEASTSADSSAGARSGGVGEEGLEATALSVADLVELDMKLSTELINKNFSNYSAWHLRTLLQQAVPGGGAEERLASSSPVDVEKELEWVQQGIYTEPNDQSVWLYHHWITILSRGCEQPRITHCAVLGGELFVFFSRPVCARGADESAALPSASACLAGAPSAVSGTLVPLGGAAAAHRRTRRLAEGRRRWAVAWRFAPEEGGAVPGLGTAASLELAASVEVLGTSVDGAPLRVSQRLAFSGCPVACDGDAEPSAASSSPALAALALPAPGQRRCELLQGELARVDELLEIEPDCRWALLARGRLAIASAAGSQTGEVEAVERAVAEGYERISSLDPLRRGFYTEARAAGLMRVRVMSWLMAGGGFSTPLDLSSLSLRHLAPAATVAAFGVRVLNVEGNELQELGPLLSLRSLEELRAARNRLVGDVSEAFALPRLRKLDLRGNTMVLKGAVVEPPPQLLEVDISDNPPILSVGKAASEQAGGAAQALLARLLAGASAEASSRWELAWDQASGLCRCCRAGA